MKIKLLGSLAIVLGVFLFAGAVSASDTDLLQPASDVVYNENVDINGSLDVDSLRVGTAGLGGVTFFNGTVLNEGTEPFTVGDDMRVDGEIYRLQKGGDPLKISDHVVPTLTNTNDFGSSSNRWNNIYAKDGNYSGDISVSGDVDGVDISEENAVWYLSGATPALIEPTPNPKESKIITGVADMPTCSSGWSKEIINLPSNFFTDTGGNKWHSYTVTASSSASGGATPTFLPYDSIGIMKYDNDTFAIFGECIHSASSYPAGVYWTAIGY